jgi:hypothetical protein
MEDAKTHTAHPDPQVHQALQDLRDLQERMVRMELRDLKENLALSDLLVRLENVLVSAKQFWSQKITQLRQMIIILVLIVPAQLLLLYPVILQIVNSWL